MTDAELINKLFHAVSTTGWVKVGQAVHIASTFLIAEGRSTESQKLLDCWHYVKNQKP